MVVVTWDMGRSSWLILCRCMQGCQQQEIAAVVWQGRDCCEMGEWQETFWCPPHLSPAWRVLLLMPGRCRQQQLHAAVVGVISVSAACRFDGYYLLAVR
jgi:hypothetical protein